MYYATIRVEIAKGEEHKSIDEAIKSAMNALAGEAHCPLVLSNVISMPLPDCLCLLVMAKPYEEPARVVGARIVPDGLAGLLQKRGLLG